MSESAMSDRDRALLRHMIATLAYRGGKVLRDAPAGFGDFTAPGVLNTPRVLLAHVVDLVDWARRFCTGDEDAYVIAEPSTWDGEVARFFAALEGFDRAVQTAALPASLERVFQAPIADALTHIGQLALLRRMAGAPVLGESYRKAEIVAGRVGREQAPPGREFALDRGALWRPKDPTGN
jgi:hypothetical protein